MANPLQVAAVRRKVIYFAAIVALFTISLVWRGKFPLPLGLGNTARAEELNKLRRLGPLERASVESRLAAGDAVDGFRPFAPAGNSVARVSDWLTSRTIESQSAETALDLRELDQGDPEIAGTALRLSLFGSRGLAVTALWWAAIEQQRRNEYQELDLLVRTVSRLQPNFTTPWIYQSWNIAYNVSVENDRLGDMYYYIARGIELLAEGERLNKKSPDMRYQIAFMYQNKFGVSDKVSTLRSLMQLSAMKPDERDPKKRFFKGDSRDIDMTQFRDFVRKNPQLVRRLRDKLKCYTPEEVVRFLEDNIKVPARYAKAGGARLPAGEQFPVLPPAMKETPDEVTPESETDDTFDAFQAARAWYEYSLTVIPPPNPDPAGGSYLSGEDRFKYRIPKSPTMIIFRQGAPRAQTYVAERLAKEGWFDADSKWYPDERADTEDERWFDRKAGEFGPGEGLRAGSSSAVEWQAAYDRWRLHGTLNSLVFDDARKAQYKLDAEGAPVGKVLENLSDAEAQAAGLTRKQIRGREALRNYDTNRYMTNFPFFLAASEAESNKRTIEARKLLWQAEQTKLANDKPKAILQYAEAIAKWRAVLRAYPDFHRPERSDRTEDDTYEQFLGLVGLLVDGEQTATRTRKLIEALRAVAPVEEDRVRQDLARTLAEEEAGVLVMAADDRVRLRVAALVNPIGALTSGAIFGGEKMLTRSVVLSEFKWLAEYSDDSARVPWVADDIKRSVKERLGLLRAAPAPNPADMKPAAPPGPGAGQ